MRALIITLLTVSSSLISTGCGGAQAENSPPDSNDPALETSVVIPDACTFLGVGELSAALGLSVEEGEPEAQPIEASQCRFRTPMSMVTVNIHPTNEADFDEFRTLLGADAEPVSGVGDGAYFWGPGVIYVRVGERGFSLRVNDDLGDRLRPAMLELARSGAEKLRS